MVERRKMVVGAKRGPCGGTKRRSAEELPPVPRGVIKRFVEAVEPYYRHIGRSERLVMRDQCLVALEYLTGRRVSELVGRILLQNGGDVVYSKRNLQEWEGRIVDVCRGRSNNGFQANVGANESTATLPSVKDVASNFTRA